VVGICSFSASVNPYFLYNPEREQHRRLKQESDQDQPYASLAAEHSPASLAASRSKGGTDRCRLLRAGGIRRPMADRLGMAQDRIGRLDRRRTR